MFDRDNPDILPQIHDDMAGYKRWGNNVYYSPYRYPNIAKVIRECALSCTIKMMI